MAKRERANASENISISKKRFELYKRAIQQFNQALEAGFFLEAITICESLITDRLESRCEELGKSMSFQTLGNLIKKLKQIEIDLEVRNLVTNELDDWRKNRNTALHEIVKFEKGESPEWKNRVEASGDYAVEGMAIFRKIDGRVTKLRKG
ncbi:MAG: hypothetical protein ACI97N_002268 [Cognaticolwellia sp.]|jgi:hypothetical protein